jgi:hypothetical protein
MKTNKSKLSRFIALVAIIGFTFAACSKKSNPESDFEAEPMDGGKSVRITKYVGDKWEVGIPSKIRKLPVTHIGERAFQEKNLTSVIIPNSVTDIGYWAFANNQLTRITIPSSVTHLSGFDNNQLSSVTIPNNVTTIGYGAFAGNQLTSITIPNSVTSIGDQAFAHNQLTGVAIPNSVTEIGSDAFDGNPLSDAGDFQFEIRDMEITITEYYGASKDIKIPETIIGLPVTSFRSGVRGRDTWGTYILYGGVFDSKQLTSVIIPDNVTYIGDMVFSNNQLTSVTIPNSVTGIGEATFRDNSLTSVSFPNTVTYIGSHAFRDNQLTSVTIPNSVTNVGDAAFAGNPLTSVIISDSVTTIEQSAFSGKELTSITIGANVTFSFGNYGFYPPFGYGFEDAYNNSGRAAGTYTRPNTDSKTWTRRASTASQNTSTPQTNTNTANTYYTTDSLRLRSEPDTSKDNRITSIPEGGSVELLEVGRTDTIEGMTAPWYRVRAADGTTGWVFSGFLRK